MIGDAEETTRETVNEETHGVENKGIALKAIVETTLGVETATNITTSKKKTIKTDTQIETTKGMRPMVGKEQIMEMRKIGAQNATGVVKRATLQDFAEPMSPKML